MTNHTKQACDRPCWQLLLPLMALLCLVTGCSTSRARCTSAMDNPAHHYLRGMEAMDEGHLDFARDRFDRAIYCNDRYSPGYSGRALAMSEQWSRQADDRRQLPAQELRDNLDLGKKLAETPADRFQYDLAQIRSATLLQERGWLSVAEDSFAAAKKEQVDDPLPYYQGIEAADFFMGLAYLEARELTKARERFAAVLAAGHDRKWYEPAERAWTKLDRTVRALDGVTVGETGFTIALQDAISRSDLAALLIDELKLDAVLAGRVLDGTSPAIKKEGSVPTDIVGHRFHKQILTVMKLRVNGLEPIVDQRTGACIFSPDETVNRGEFALILDDMLTKLARGQQLHLQPPVQGLISFRDVPPASPWYRAVLNVTAHGIMKKDPSGEFRINDVVDGPEAIVAIRMLKQVIDN